MHIHPKGYKIIGYTAIIVLVPAILVHFLFPSLTFLFVFMYFVAACILIWAISFFRVPHREVNTTADTIVSSADGTVVAIEEVYESEYFKDNRILVSVFMSPLNVHINWFPFDGTIAYVKYHAGKFLVANHPKSSTENERNTIVVKDNKGREVLVRQIAGLLARRIVCFVQAGDTGKRGEEFGLIRFGSRIDFYMPVGTEIIVKLGDKTKGNITVLGKFQK